MLGAVSWGNTAHPSGKAAGGTWQTVLALCIPDVLPAHMARRSSHVTLVHPVGPVWLGELRSH